MGTACVRQRCVVADLPAKSLTDEAPVMISHHLNHRMWEARTGLLMRLNFHLIMEDALRKLPPNNCIQVWVQQLTLVMSGCETARKMRWLD